jgi:hypothetical protein
MHVINLDLLRASGAYHPDGRPKDPHAHHRAEHLATLKAERAAWWQGTLARIVALGRKAARSQINAPSTCP